MSASQAKETTRRRKNILMRQLEKESEQFSASYSLFLIEKETCLFCWPMISLSLFFRECLFLLSTDMNAHFTGMSSRERDIGADRQSNRHFFHNVSLSSSSSSSTLSLSVGHCLLCCIIFDSVFLSTPPNSPLDSS